MSGKIHGLCTIAIPMRKKKTNTLSRLACLLLTVSLLWLLPGCGSGSASPFPPAEETVRAAAEELDWTLLPEETQVWAEDQVLYTLKTDGQMDAVLSCAVEKGKRSLTENCTAAGLPDKPVFTWEDWQKAITLAETLYGGFSEGELYQTLSALAIPEPEDTATGQGAISWEAELPAAYARVWYTVGAGSTESGFASTDVQDWRTTFSISLYASKSACESERT